MHTPTPANGGFKRQVVFRIGVEDWPLLEAAAAEHGSIQAAVLAGIRALTQPAPRPEAAAPKRRQEAPRPPVSARASTAEGSDPATDDRAAPGRDEEISAREAAQLLGLKTSTISGYIRSERLPGRYDGEPSWRGWLTTRAAVDEYVKATRGSRRGR